MAIKNYRSHSYKLSIVIPCFNEGGTLLNLLSNLKLGSMGNPPTP